MHRREKKTIEGNLVQNSTHLHRKSIFIFFV
jgi:hypothetical protein